MGFPVFLFTSRHCKNAPTKIAFVTGNPISNRRTFNYTPFCITQVKCRNKLYHPNIDLEGNVCLNILREEWKPVLNISSVIYGLLHLMEAPNPNDPLNKEAAKVCGWERWLGSRCVGGRRVLGQGVWVGEVFGVKVCEWEAYLGSRCVGGIGVWGHHEA